MGKFFEPIIDISQRLDVPSECGLSKFVSAADIQQLVDMCKPGDNIGFVWVGSGAPDVAAYPEMKNFIWIDLSGGYFPYPFRIYNWEMNSWDVTRPADGTITGEVLADASVYITKLRPASGTAGQVIMVNADTTKFVYVFAKDAIADKTLEIGKLKVPDGTAEQSYLMHTANGVLAFATLTSSQISSIISDGSLTVAKLATTPGTTGQSIRVSSTTPPKWEFYNPSTGGAYTGPTVPNCETTQAGQMLEVHDTLANTYKLINKSSFISASVANFDIRVIDNITIPSESTTTKTPHPFATIVPSFLRVVLKCTGATFGYAAGTELDLNHVFDGTDIRCYVSSVDATNVNITAVNIQDSPRLPGLAPPTGNADREVQLDKTKWVIKAYVGKLL